MAVPDTLASNAALIIAQGVGLMIYRIYFSPIARFPGPKIAAFTYWYEFHHDALLGGKYVWQIQEMYRHYGPVVRINPHELHIADPDYYTTLYASGREQRDKVPKHVRQFGAPDTVLGAVPHDLHKMRRASMSPFFSKSSVYRLEPMIREKSTR